MTYETAGPFVAASRPIRRSGLVPEFSGRGAATYGPLSGGGSMLLAATRKAGLDTELAAFPRLTALAELFAQDIWQVTEPTSHSNYSSLEERATALAGSGTRSPNQIADDRKPAGSRRRLVGGAGYESNWPGDAARRFLQDCRLKCCFSLIPAVEATRADECLSCSYGDIGKPVTHTFDSRLPETPMPHRYDQRSPA